MVVHILSQTETASTDKLKFYGSVRGSSSRIGSHYVVVNGRSPPPPSMAEGPLPRPSGPDGRRAVLDFYVRAMVLSLALSFG